MIPHTQLIIADPSQGDGHDANGESGDCLRACVASMLDLELTDVPNFGNAGGDWAWFRALRVWARERGQDFAAVKMEFPLAYDGPPPVQQAIGTGPSPRGEFLHSLLVDVTTGDIVHDPHPSRAGLSGDLVDVMALTCPYEPDPDEQLAIYRADKP